MFRRFMIVCWVLFAIPAIVSLASWPMYYKYGNDIDALFVEPESVSPAITFGQNDRVIRLSDVDRLQALERKQEEWRIAALAGLGIATAILLWNILCHTGHWIWMGRQIRVNGHGPSN